MHEIQPPFFHKVRKLIEQVEFNSFFAQSVIENHVTGQVFVDIDNQLHSFLYTLKGTEHRPVCENEVTAMLVEIDGTLTPDNTGGTYMA